MSIKDALNWTISTSTVEHFCAFPQDADVRRIYVIFFDYFLISVEKLISNWCNCFFLSFVFIDFDSFNDKTSYERLSKSTYQGSHKDNCATMKKIPPIKFSFISWTEDDGFWKWIDKGSAAAFMQEDEVFFQGESPAFRLADVVKQSCDWVCGKFQRHNYLYTPYMSLKNILLLLETHFEQHWKSNTHKTDVSTSAPAGSSLCYKMTSGAIPSNDCSLDLLITKELKCQGILIFSNLVSTPNQ